MRQTQLNRLKDGLNSPDPARRIVTLEQAMSTCDSTLRRVALSTAFASSDSDLRSVALKAAIRSAPSFVVTVTGRDRTEQGERLLAKLGTNIEVHIHGYSPETNTFQTSTSASNSRPGPYAGSGTGLFRASTGAVSGDRLSFAFDVNRVDFGTGCGGVAVLQGDSTVLKGTMTCNGSTVANYNITIDVLR